MRSSATRMPTAVSAGRAIRSNRCRRARFPKPLRRLWNPPPISLQRRSSKSCKRYSAVRAAASRVRRSPATASARIASSPRPKVGNIARVPVHQLQQAIDFALHIPGREGNGRQQIVARQSLIGRWKDPGAQRKVARAQELGFHTPEFCGSSAAGQFLHVASRRNEALLASGSQQQSAAPLRATHAHRNQSFFARQAPVAETPESSETSVVLALHWPPGVRNRDLRRSRLRLGPGSTAEAFGRGRHHQRRLAVDPHMRGIRISAKPSATNRKRFAQRHNRRNRDRALTVVVGLPQAESIRAAAVAARALGKQNAAGRRRRKKRAARVHPWSAL